MSRDAGKCLVAMSFLASAGCLRLAFLASSMIVPHGRRREWRDEWKAELCWRKDVWCRAEILDSGLSGKALKVPNAFTCGSLARGMLLDAAWLRFDDLWDSAEAGGRRGSARWCLQMLTFCCLISEAAEWVLAGSWRAIEAAFTDHLLGCFVYVVAPAVLVGIATSPLRPRKCDRARSRLVGLMSANVRWNLFLAAKVALTLTWSFLFSGAITLAAQKLIGHWADWLELLTTALAVVLSMRWALLNQGQRCQHCLRMLSEPTRVGFASRNFLDWNGMELYCADGHGLLHVTEMEGSWCWYDLWVELDPTWHGLFSS